MSQNSLLASYSDWVKLRFKSLYDFELRRFYLVCRRCNRNHSKKLFKFRKWLSERELSVVSLELTGAYHLPMNDGLDTLLLS